jgi:S1-C subfamily serine protease
MLADGKRYRARVVGRSLAHDIAVLKVFAPLKDMKSLALGTSRDLQVGQSVLAIGNPWGLDHTMTNGIVSAIGREVVLNPYFGTRIRNAIQTDAAINPGNSGGPLLDSSGRLIGMNTLIRSTTGSSAGIGFAIPADTLNRVVPVLIAKGQIERPELGFTSWSDVDARVLGVKHGVAVSEVSPGGLADRAGLKGSLILQGASPLTPKDVRLGDVIVSFQGKPIENSPQLFDALELEPADATLVFEVLREGQRTKVTIRPNAPKEVQGPQA